MSSVSKPRVRHNRHKQGLNLTLEKLSADFREKVKIPAKIASLIPVVCFIIFTIVLSSGSGRGIKPDKDSGFYIYLLVAIVIAVLPYVKHPSLEK